MSRPALAIVLGPVVVILAYALLRTPAPFAPPAETGAIARAYAAKRSDLVVESGGVVVRSLRDDVHGSRHQRFIVRLDDGHTVLVSHNIDLAPRIDAIRAGDRVEFRGEYEWTDQGGVVHWTHHDPQGRRPGGWVRHDGREYR